MKTLETSLGGWFDGRFSKRFVTLICLSIPLLATGQSLRLLSSDPADGAIGVPLQTTLSFTFDAALDTSRVGETEDGPRYVVFPTHRVQASKPRFSADFRTIIIDVTHEPGIDVTWAFLNLVAADGTPQPRVELVRYTTSASRPDVTITGRLLSDIPDPDYDRAIVLLVSDLEWMDEDGGPDEALVAAGTTMPGHDLYAIPFVRPGTYYLMAFLFDESSPFAIGILKGMDNEARAITVGTESLSGLDIRLETFDFGPADPVDALQAWDAVRTIILNERPDARPFAIEGANPTMPPDGRTDQWTVVYYTDVDSLVHLFFMDGDRIRERMTIHVSEIPEDERPEGDFNTIKTLPANAIGSQQAFTIALANGMQSQLMAYPGGFDHHVRVGYLLSHFHFEYPGLVNAASEPFWAIEYEVWLPDSTRFWTYLMDAASGSFIGRIYRSEPNGFGGPFEFIGSNPQGKSVNVPLSTVLEFTFSEPVHANHLQLDQHITAVPEPQIASITLSGDQRSIRIEVTHQPLTDYTWLFPDVRSANGSWLPEVPVVRYTTRPDFSPLSLAGGLLWSAPDEAPVEGLIRNIIALFDSPDYLSGDMEGEPTGIVAAGTTDRHSDAWTVGNLRPGTYYPGVFQLLYGFDGSVELLSYGFVRDGAGKPAPVTITDAPVAGVMITMRGLEPGPTPVGVTEVYDRARSLVRGANPAARFVLAWGREDVDPPRTPDGKTDDWMFIFYDEASGMVDQVYVDSKDIQEHIRFHLNEVPEEERIDPASITFLPDAFLPNETALQTALANGLSDLMAQFPQDNVWMQVGYQLSGIYGNYPTHLNATSNPFWEVKFNGEIYRYDPEFELLRETEAFFVIDAITGAYITNTITTDIGSGPDLPDGFELLPNMPNPFNPSTVIRYQVSGAHGGTPLRLAVYDVLGREVAVLVDGVMPAGEHLTRFDASRLPSGMYIAVLESGGQRRFRSMMLIK